MSDPKEGVGTTVDIEESAFCATRNTMLATAKSLPDALRVVVEQKVEDGLVQLHIGLNGASHTVSFRHGMRMQQLKEKVLKTTGIPIEEQKYVFVDDARLVDDDLLVPLDEPLRLIRSAKPASPSDPAAAGDAVVSEQETSQSDSFVEGAGGELSWCRGTGAARWADVTDAADDSSVQENVDNVENVDEARSVQLAACISDTKDESVQGSSVARCFTERWRLKDKSERQHQFYIGVPEHRREEFRVAERIKAATPSIYELASW